jgi:cob(I)alamin adenosyltransferase
MKIYTGGGDGGETSLIGGARVPKWHPRLEACGALDELNALLGALRLHVAGRAAEAALEGIQWDMFALGAAVADPKCGAEPPALRFQVADMEADIDRMRPDGGPSGFVLPGGSPAAAAGHHARTVCRRAERLAAPLCAGGEAPAWVGAYLNRLGDWLFAVSSSSF